MDCSRRAFLTCRWVAQQDSCGAGAPAREAPAAPAVQELPSDFSPALMRAQAQMMGLDADALSPAELSEAILKALNAQRPPAA
ncbi:MAG: hypothetical protein HUK26_01910 [Duodenibacillus sp.]|nr:hypothetical protein [Duodenibacillus sp.]